MKRLLYKVYSNLFAIFGEYSLKISHPIFILIYPFHIFYYLIYKGYFQKYLLFIIKNFILRRKSIRILKNKIIKIKGSKFSYIYSGSWNVIKIFNSQEVQDKEEHAVIYFDKPWWNNYWHFMIEGLPLLFIISNSYNHKFKKIYIQDNNFWNQIFPFFSNLGINSEVNFIKSRKEIKESSFYKFVQFPGSSNPHPELVSISKNLAYKLFDLSTRKSYKNKDSKIYKNIFFIRDQLRRNTNIDKSAKKLIKKNGFKIYNSSNIKYIWDGLRLFYFAEKLIMPHGAGLVNMLVASEKCQIIELYSPLYSNIVSSCMSDYLNIKLKKVVIWPKFKELILFKNLSPLGRIENDLKIDIKSVEKIFKSFS